MFSCEVCAATFTRKDNLNRHSITHNGVKFTCDICLKSFTRKFKLNQHKKNVHRESVIRVASAVVIGQPPAAASAPPAIAPVPTSGPWDGAICDDELLEIMNDFENQGKKIHYSNILLGR